MKNKSYSFITSKTGRIDTLISEYFKSKTETKFISRSRTQKIIRAGNVSCNNKKILKVSEQIRTNTEVKIQLELTKSNNTLKAYDLDLEVIYEDQYLMVINKPAGLTMHPGAGNKDKTLLNALVSKIKPKAFSNEVSNPGIVHRLDKDTSGLCIVAKNEQIHVAMQEQIQKREIKRTYLALVLVSPRGNKHIQKNPTGTITVNLKRNPKNRKIFSVVNSGGRIAITHYKLISAKNYTALVELVLETGRTHQIRVSLAQIGSPVIGDRSYGNFQTLPKELLKAATNFGRQALHAYKLEFTHPVTNKKLSLTSEVPKEMKELIRRSAACRSISCGSAAFQAA